MELAYTRLLTNPEATYKNYFRNIYATYGMAKDSNLKNLSAKMKAGYLPDKSYKVYVPKPNGLNRMYTIMTIEDQIVYQAFANKLAEQMQIDSVKKRYKKSVFGNLFAGKGSDFFFKRWEDSYKAYTKAIIKAYECGNLYIASFDLTACYDSINHSLLRRILLKYHFSEACIGEMESMLEQWCSPSLDYMLGVGIPQGPQASGIVAEAVLSEYDEYAEWLQKNYSFKYFRYVDDIKILAKDEKTVRWVLFLLDKKSKELGLFPQASKISVHSIVDIYEEVKQISKPLFEDETEEEEKPEEAAKRLSMLVKEKSKDVTSIKRYMQFLMPNSRNNRLAIRLLSQYPETLPAFVYYVQRYPRKLPPSIIDYLRECSLDRTKQYAAGVLLRVSVFNMSSKDVTDFGDISNELLRLDKKEAFLFDPLFKEQLYLLLILSGKYTTKTYMNKVKKENNWWIKQQLLSDLSICGAPEDIIKRIVSMSLVSNNPDESLGAVMQVVMAPSRYGTSDKSKIPAVAQEALKKAGIIRRSKYSTSQINKYLESILDIKLSIKWKQYLGTDHDNVERCVFAAMTYWRTDLTAFVNLWDTIDDRILYVLTKAHPELGGYTLGQIGGVVSSNGLKNNVPKYHNLVNEIHSLRLSSYLSHTVIKGTGKYTGPIPFKEKKRIQKLLIEGMSELNSYW